MARRNSVACCETRNRAQPSRGPVVASLTFAALIVFGVVAQLGAFYHWSMPLIAVALLYEHKTEKLDLSELIGLFFRATLSLAQCFLSLSAWTDCASPGDCWLQSSRAGEPFLPTLRLTLPRASLGVRRQILFPARSAQFSARDLPGSVVRPWKGRWRHCVVVKVGLTPRSNKARSARRGPCLLPLLRRCPNHRTRCHARTRLSRPLLRLGV